MSYKLSLIISMVFVVVFSLFAIDMIQIQNAYSLLDSKSINISYFLSKYGDISFEAHQYIERQYDVDFNVLSQGYPAYGDNIIYTISTTCHPLVLGSNLKISLKRMAVVGYYN